MRRLGLVPYGKGLEIQEGLVRERQAGRIPDTILFLEHEPVFTLGRNARHENLLLSPAALLEQGFSVFECGRGGDVTYHGPGQVVGYPILDLAPDRKDVHRYVRDLEEVLIRTVRDFGLSAERVPGLTGCWVGEKKVAAIGVRLSRWVTSHGFALNVSNDLAPFSLVVPCGIRDKGVTTLSELLQKKVELDDVIPHLTHHMCDVFDRFV